MTTLHAARSGTMKRSALEDLEFRFPVSDEVRIAYLDRVETMAPRALPLKHSTLATRVFLRCRRVPVALDSVKGVELAVAADGAPVLLINAEMIVSIDDDDGVLFALALPAIDHMLGYLRPAATAYDQRSLDNARIARVALASHLLLKMGFSLPTVGGKTIGLDPNALYNWAKSKARQHGVTFPDSLDGFYANEMVVYGTLQAIPENRRGGTGWYDGTGGTIPAEPAAATASGAPAAVMPEIEIPRHAGEIGRIIETSLESVVRKAGVEKSESAKTELGRLMDATGDSPVAAATWDRLGAHVVRGRAPMSKPMARDWVVWTKRFVAHHVADRRGRLQYDRRKPFDIRVARCGKRKKKVGYVGLDVSGSMRSEWLTTFLATMGTQFPDLQIVFVNWDHNASLIEKGRDVLGGGSTRFECFDDFVADHCEKNRWKPDFVIAVTDGLYSPPKLRFRPDLYAFLIMPGGSAFMEHGYTLPGGENVPAQQVFKLTAEQVAA